MSVAVLRTKNQVLTPRYPYKGFLQKITHKLPIGHTIFETDIFIEGAPQHRSTVFQIHDGKEIKDADHLG